nr:hypothetical protein [uncultured Vibrio sp.]
MKQQKHFRNCIELLSNQLEKIEEKVSKTDVDLKDELSFLELKSLFKFKQKKYEYSIFLEHKIHERKNKSLLKHEIHEDLIHIKNIFLKK